MTKDQARTTNGSAVSLDQTLHEIIGHVAPVRVAALQILIFHIEMQANNQSNVSCDELMEAGASVKNGFEMMSKLVDKTLDPLDIKLPKSLATILEESTEAMGELARLMDRCHLASDGTIKGFSPTADMYGLCCTRVAKGVSAFNAGLGEFFLSLNEKGKEDTMSKTKTIALEIGKIGRVINMVATNASIEAARAGDAGKGFTVIADEVKVLSSRVSSLSVSLTDRANA